MDFSISVSNFLKVSLNTDWNIREATMFSTTLSMVSPILTIAFSPALKASTSEFWILGAKLPANSVTISLILVHDFSSLFSKSMYCCNISFVSSLTSTLFLALSAIALSISHTPLADCFNR